MFDNAILYEIEKLRKVLRRIIDDIYWSEIIKSKKYVLELYKIDYKYNKKDAFNLLYMSGENTPNKKVIYLFTIFEDVYENLVVSLNHMKESKVENAIRHLQRISCDDFYVFLRLYYSIKKGEPLPFGWNFDISDTIDDDFIDMLNKLPNQNCGELVNYRALPMLIYGDSSISLGKIIDSVSIKNKLDYYFEDLTMLSSQSYYYAAFLFQIINAYTNLLYEIREALVSESDVDFSVDKSKIKRIYARFSSDIRLMINFPNELL